MKIGQLEHKLPLGFITFTFVHEHDCNLCLIPLRPLMKLYSLNLIVFKAEIFFLMPNYFGLVQYRRHSDSTKTKTETLHVVINIINFPRFSRYY
jgi:hypothetical protein